MATTNFNPEGVCVVCARKGLKPSPPFAFPFSKMAAKGTHAPPPQVIVRLRGHVTGEPGSGQLL